MPYSITTKDGITIPDIPDDVAPDAPELKAMVERIRAGQKPTEKPMASSQPQMSAADVAVSAVKNFPSSVGSMLGDIYQAVSSPVQTTKAVLDLGAGILQNALPERLVQAVGEDKASRELASKVGQHYVERYGSVEGAKRALATDPAGVTYNARDIVKDGSNNNVYLCNTTHTSTGTTPISSNADVAKWDLIVDAQSGTAGFFQQNIGTSVTTSSVASNLWNHYAVSLANSASSINVNFYVNGDLNSSYALGTTISDVTGGLVANLGALRTAPSGVSGVGLGWGKLSGSIDEFRYWKTERTDREIGRNWWTYVGGGTNTDDANTDLGVYYKFNEGITTTSSADSIVLDYSGRVSNGTWVGYSSVSRNTGSAINEFTTKQLSSEEMKTRHSGSVKNFSLLFSFSFEFISPV